MRLKNIKFKPLISSKKLLLAILLPFLYSAFVLSFVWWHCYFSQFKGGKNGQLDAYRHTLASALVAYTTSPKVVFLVTALMERKNKAPNIMDRHNNAIGGQIGARIPNRADSLKLKALESDVKMHVLQGAINTPNSTQITWLPVQYWRESLWW